jgi:uncharacterized protein (DUF1800 family)
MQLGKLFAAVLVIFSSATSWTMNGDAVAAAVNCPFAVSASTSGARARLAVDSTILARYLRDMRADALASGVDNLDAAQRTQVQHRIGAQLTRLDVDGDKSFTTNDALVIARHLAGFPAASWLDGVTLSPHATRTTGPAIADYINAGCQLTGNAALFDAARFLSQATLGYTRAELNRVVNIGYDMWLDEQLSMPVKFSHVTQVKAQAATYTGQWQNRPGMWDVNDSMWIGMVDSDDQLRQRMMWALSQIFVVSIKDGAVYYQGNGIAAYVDMLYAKGFDNFRVLIESVTRSTAMGYYLSHVYNEKENPALGSVPDQNYARELMQLFTIGLWELNIDGTRKLDNAGDPIPTYGTADVVGVSRVLTGWTFDQATTQDWNNYYGFWNYPDNAAQERPMRAYAAHHSTSEKRFLGITIPASSSPAPAGAAEAGLKVLLDRLFEHPNVGPFIGKQLIQRLVTSNPSRAYVTRVANAFNDNGNGVRGDMKAVIRAVLLDPEARNAAMIGEPSFGKIREPVLRMGQLMRTLNATRPTDNFSFGIGQWLYDKSKGLWQTPLGSNTVFNFYRPDFRPANSALATAGLVAPEMQLVNQSTVDDIQWFFRSVLENAGITNCCSEAERNTFYLKLNYSSLLPLVANPPALADELNVLFMSGQMTPALRTNIIQAVNDEYRSSSQTSGMPRGLTQMKLSAALYTMLLSPEYVVQK